MFPVGPRFSPRCLQALRCAVGAIGMLAEVSCNQPKATPDYLVCIKIYGDPGQPLAGAKVAFAGRSFGVSNADGFVPLTLHGTEGQILAFQVNCPEGYRSPATPVSVALKHLSESERRPEYEAYCQPLLRTLVVAIRAEHGPNLPVLYLGREVARTDRAGAAHFAVKTPPEDTIELTLDTSSNADLRPHNPSARFQVAQHDDWVVFDQPFSVAARPTPRKIARRQPAIVNIRGRRQ